MQNIIYLDKGPVFKRLSFLMRIKLNSATAEEYFSEKLSYLNLKIFK